MDTLSLQRIVTDGLLLSAAVSVIVLGSLYANPRLWLQDYPKEIQAIVPPLSTTEKRWRAVVGIVFLTVFLGGLVLSAAQFKAANGASSFLSVYLHTFIVLNIVNLFDAVILDYLLLTLMKPKFAVIPGAEGMEYLYHNPRMHLANYLKGVVIATVVTLPVALVIAR